MWQMQAELHTWKVVIRFCRYRDLAKSVWVRSKQSSIESKQNNTKAKELAAQHARPPHCSLALLLLGPFLFLLGTTPELPSWVWTLHFTRAILPLQGMKGHHLVFSLQQMGSLGNNVAIQLSSALVMKVRRMLGRLRPDRQRTEAQSNIQQGHKCKEQWQSGSARVTAPSLHMPQTLKSAPDAVVAGHLHDVQPDGHHQHPHLAHRVCVSTLCHMHTHARWNCLDKAVLSACFCSTASDLIPEVRWSMGMCTAGALPPADAVRFLFSPRT